MSAQPITRQDILRQVIQSCQVCSLAMADENCIPYVLPFNFGTDGQYIWFHSAMTGRKIDILKQNPTVCVIFSNDFELGHRHENVACSYFMKYKSVMINGNVEFVEDSELKKMGMNIIMKHYTGKDDFLYNTPAINNVMVFRLKLDDISGRSYGY